MIIGLFRRGPQCSGLRFETVIYNNAPALVRLQRRPPRRACSLVEVIDGKITHFYAMRNPEKLAGDRQSRGRSAASVSVTLGRCGSSGSATWAAPLRCCAPSPTPQPGTGLPPPAALIGEWFGSGAVIAPSVAVTPVDVSEVFDVSPGASDGAVGGGWFGYLSYPDAGADGLGPRIPEAAGGWSDCVLTPGQRRAVVVRKPLRRTAFRMGLRSAARSCPHLGDVDIAWGDADREAHRRGVLAASRRSRRARSTRRACARSSPAASTARPSTSSSTPSSAPPPPGRPTWPATGARWRRCRRNCSCGGAATR